MILTLFKPNISKQTAMPTFTKFKIMNEMKGNEKEILCTGFLKKQNFS